jgi:uncharacterized protein YqgQ
MFWMNHVMRKSQYLHSFAVLRLEQGIQNKLIGGNS